MHCVETTRQASPWRRRSRTRSISALRCAGQRVCRQEKALLRRAEVRKLFVEPRRVPAQVDDATDALRTRPSPRRLPPAALASARATLPACGAAPRRATRSRGRSPGASIRHPGARRSSAGWRWKRRRCSHSARTIRPTARSVACVSCPGRLCASSKTITLCGDVVQLAQIAGLPAEQGLEKAHGRGDDEGMLPAGAETRGVRRRIPAGCDLRGCPG